MKWIIRLVVVASAFAFMAVSFGENFSPSVAVLAQAAGQAQVN